jgi:hypothetical protein
MTLKLLLRDQWCNELCFDFRARVNRSLKRIYERQQREHRTLAQPSKRIPLFGRGNRQLREQKSVSPERAINLPHASDEHDTTSDA